MPGPVRHLALRVLRVAGALVAALVIAAVGGVLVLANSAWGHEQVRLLALKVLRGSVHGDVQIGRVDGDLLGHIVLTNFAISDSVGTAIIDARRIEASYDLIDLVRRRLYLRRVRLDSVILLLHEAPNNTWNYDRALPSAPDTGGPKRPGWGSWLTLSDVQITRSDITVRTPWRPDSVLDGPGRDSAIRVALGPDSRVAVAAVAHGYEQTSAFHHVNAAIPIAVLAQPGRATKVIHVGALSADIEAFRPPLLSVRALAGTFYLTKDSLSWSAATAIRPALKADGWYSGTGNRMGVTLKLDSTALADLRFLDPRLPSDGWVSADAVITWRGRSQDYLAQRVVLSSGATRLAGRIGVTLGDSVVFRNTDLQFAGIDAPFLSRFVPDLRVPLRGVASGRARVSGSLRALALDADLNYEDQRSGRSRVLVAGRFAVPSHGGPRAAAVATGYRADSLRITLAPLQTALVHELSPTIRVRGALTGQAVIDGSTTQSLTISANLIHSQRDAQSHLTVDGLLTFAPPSNKVQSSSGLRPKWVDVSASITPIDSGLLAAFIPSASFAGGGNGHVTVTGSLDALTVHARVAVGDSPDSNTLAVDGRLDLASPSIGYDLKAAAQRFDANTVFGSAPRTDLTLTVSAKGRGIAPETLTSTLDVEVGRSSFGRFAIDSARVHGSASGGQLHLDTALVRATATSADLHGEIGLDSLHSGTLAYRLAVDSLGAYHGFVPADTELIPERREPIEVAIERAQADSAYRADATEVERAIAGAPAPALVVDTPATLRRDQLAGRVVTTGTVRGTIHRLEVRGDLAADSLIAWGSAARQARMTYDANYDAALPGTHVSPAKVDLHLREATIEGFALDSADVRTTYNEPEGTVRLIAYRDSLRDYLINAHVRYTAAERELRYDTLTFRFDTTVWSASHEGSVQLLPDRLNIQKIELTSGQSGRISVDGVFPTKSGIPADLHVLIHDLDVGDIRDIAESDIPIRGKFSMQASLSGSADLPRLQGSASLVNATVRKTALPDVRVAFGYDTATIYAHVQMAPTENPSVSFADGEASVPIKLTLGAGGSHLGSGALRGVLRLDSLPIDVVPEFISSVRDIGGRVSGKVEVGGTVARPTARGILALDRGSATILATGTSVRDIVARIQIHGDSLVLDSLVGQTPSTGGRLRLAGLLDRSDSAVTVLNVAMSTANARVLNTRDMGHIDLDASLTISGPTTSLFLFGTAKVHNSVYYLPIATGKRLVNINDPTVYAIADLSNPSVRDVIPGSTTFLSHSRMNVDVTVERNSWVRSPTANVEINTVDPVTVRIDRRHSAIVVEGTVNTDRGQYTFLSKRFDITKGIATFNGSPDLNPTIQASGEYQVPVPGRQPIAIQFLVSGRTDSLKLSVSSNAQPPIAQSTLLSYLAFSTPSSGISQQTQSSSLTGTGNSGNIVGSASSYVQAQLASTAIGVLANEGSGALGRSLGADVLNITTGNLYTDIGQHDAAATILQTTQIEYGKYVTPQTYVALVASVAPGGRIVHDIGHNLNISLGLEPLYLLGPATLSETTDTPLTGVLGLTLVRTWRF